MEEETRLLHPPLTVPRPDNPPLVQPLFQSVKFTVEKTDQLRSLSDIYLYSRIANPTVRHLEETLATLQGCDEAIAVGSGMAAIASLFLGLLKSGDHVIHFVQSYSPVRGFVRNFLSKFGVEATYCSLTDWEGIQRAVRPGKTKLLFFETPANPMTRVAHIANLVELAKKHHFYLALDNTFAGFHNHRDCGIDFYIHSLTKFAGGHGDVMGGVILGRKELISVIRTSVIALGPTLDPHAAFLLNRGLKTYFLRYERSCENAMKVAQFLETHPQVRRVFYPGLASHPDAQLARQQQRDFGAIVSFQLRGDLATALALIDKLNIFTLAGSLGSTESLIVPASLFFAGDLSPEELKISEIEPGTVRLSLGTEAAQDLIEDLQQALDALLS